MTETKTETKNPRLSVFETKTRSADKNNAGLNKLPLFWDSLAVMFFYSMYFCALCTLTLVCFALCYANKRNPQLHKIRRKVSKNSKRVRKSADAWYYLPKSSKIKNVSLQEVGVNVLLYLLTSLKFSWRQYWHFSSFRALFSVDISTFKARPWSRQNGYPETLSVALHQNPL